MKVFVTGVGGQLGYDVMNELAKRGKKFGIGLPRPLLPKEIADQEGLSIARISQIFRTVIDQMQKNQVKYNIDPNVLFDAVKKIY